jgi:ubiquinone/menaquinone biosynthesis C-methylase UbiE
MSGSGIDPDAGLALFGSGAYDAKTSAAVEDVARAWLEEQSLHPFIREAGERTLEALDLRPGQRVVDVGCGTGVFLPAIAANVGSGGRVVGLDHSQAFLKEARTRIAAQHLEEVVSLVAGDAHRLPFDDDAFDAAHTERVLMHLEDPDAAIRELRRVVRPEGRVVSAEIYPHGGTVDHPDHLMAERLARTIVSQVRNPWMGLELRRRFVSAGLDDVRVRIVIDVEDELDPLEAVEVRAVAKELGESGELDPAEAEAFVDTMVESSERGMHCGYSLMFVAVGRVPEPG